MMDSGDGDVRLAGLSDRRLGEAWRSCRCLVHRLLVSRRTAVDPKPHAWLGSGCSIRRKLAESRPRRPAVCVQIWSLEPKPRKSVGESIPRSSFGAKLERAVRQDVLPLASATLEQ